MANGWKPPSEQIEKEKERKAKLKQRLWYNQNGLCHFCHGEMLYINWIVKPTPQPPPDEYATIDHLIDLTNSNQRDNREKYLVLSCYHCNQSRAKLHKAHGVKRYDLRAKYRTKKKAHKLKTVDTNRSEDI